MKHFYWDEHAVEEDLRTLKENGIEILRVFPNWRDFQPVEQLYGSSGQPRQLCLAGDSRPANPYYLDEKMLSRFQDLCALAQKHGFRLVVGLVTGWRIPSPRARPRVKAVFPAPRSPK